jgi:predicted ATPase
VERAAQASGGFVLDDSNAKAVATICRRLDGIPLAIELAASRVWVMPIRQIVARLDNVFRLLMSGARPVMPRQQTLKATIDWSYNLLNLQEKTVLQRLSAFSGGWSLEAAEKIIPDSAVK